ncbi:longitudinals lacking protein, isoforms A/B/D/L isoform X2 [Zootermopsis nevadensis]|uniref:longitudinals lacking protein, isoforms A/B/D/L isoform X2 n=1 Tax=Zootermopsis nevadensis TaxID=136037 RepID=UPI000B8E3D1E|nr:longitudinals lacking protein, isoforms A/B/D/L isoform X2 [Zootermopsis nevadensis]
MGSEQQFCLKWNNHQSTIVAGFDTLLESGTLVDCTLAAEGQYLKAHKVVLSACSPYFELLLSQHDEKHPIVILKDIKFQELKAMVDYMYHGEVNISQDQLGALLKAAESLQIKGLSDSGGGGSERENVDKRHHGTRKQTIPPPQPRSSPVPSHSSTVGHRRQAPLPPAAPPQIIDLPEDDDPPPPRPPPLPRVPSSREGSPSPPPKRKRHRRRSSGEEGSLSAAPVVPLTEGTHETSSSSELPPQSQPAPSASVPSIPANITPVVPPSAEPATHPSSQASEQPVTETELLNPPQVAEVASPRQPPREMAHEQVLEPVQKLEPPSEVLLEPKSEYLEDDMNEDSVEDLTLDDDMDEIDQARPGPSHGGEGSSQGAGFAPWHVADQSRDEVFMAAQESVGAQRDSQDEYELDPWHFLSVEESMPLNTNISEPLQKKIENVVSSQWKLADALQMSSSVHHKKPQFLFSNTMTSDSSILSRNVREYSGSVKGESPHFSHLNQQQPSQPQEKFSCPLGCGKVYSQNKNLQYHMKYECGKEPRFQCPYCPHRTKRKNNLMLHISSQHSDFHDQPFTL